MNKISIIYLLGPGHCGSTLLDLMMGSHSKIAGVGELEKYPLSGVNRKEIMKCVCKKDILGCPFWQRVFSDILPKKELAVRSRSFDFLRGRKKYYGIDNIDQYLTMSEKIYKNILVHSGKEIVFDSSKHPQRLELFLSDKNFDLTILHMVRDGRGVSWSYKKKYGGVIPPVRRWLMSNLKIELVA